MFFEKRSIAFITTNRADFGLLCPIIKKMKQSSVFDVKILCSGSHLSEKHGYTIKEVRSLGYEPDAEIPILLDNRSGLDVALMVSDAISKFANVFDNLKPDIIFLLGDRTEVFAAAQAASYLHLPIAHYFGGDSAAGTYDNLVRHCITKLSSLHFVSSAESYKRVLQLGEDAKNIYIVGSTAVDNVKSHLNYDDDFLENLGVSKKGSLFLITFHPLTMSAQNSTVELTVLLSSLSKISYEREISMVFTAANSDEGGQEINDLIKSFTNKNANCYFFASLGMKKYLNLMSRADVVIGNSSSGIYEAPILGIPSVDIGERQKGRFPNLRSVIRSQANEKQIIDSVLSALIMDKTSITHCFGDGNAAEKINVVMENLENVDTLQIKLFHDLLI